MHKLVYLYVFPSFLYFWINLVFIKKQKNPKTNKTPPLQRNQRHYPQRELQVYRRFGGHTEQTGTAWVGQSVWASQEWPGDCPPRAQREPASCPAFHPHQHWYCCTENTLLSSFSPLGVRCTTCCLTLSNWETNIHRNQLLPFLTAFLRVLMKAGVPLVKGIWLCGSSLRKQRCSKDVHSRLQVSASCMHNAQR